MLCVGNHSFGWVLLSLVGVLVRIVYYLITSPYFKLFSDPNKFL